MTESNGIGNNKEKTTYLFDGIECEIIAINKRGVAKVFFIGGGIDYIHESRLEPCKK